MVPFTSGALGFGAKLLAFQPGHNSRDGSNIFKAHFPFSAVLYNGSSDWTRTSDIRINSPSFYRLNYRGIIIGPGNTIWTCDILLPKQALYQAELYLDNLNVEFCCFYDNQSPQPWGKIPTMPKNGVLAWLPWSNTLNSNLNQRYEYIRLFCWN